ncbi:hypothetical protein SCHPADRAFT_329817 [Schizopora paradoxa]|uniref:Uncharacterized protein n=1 Tax=Schizopora paradoxa TaxID=27342 RepID=A0A0H2SB67_9AGAM|nr:hypothetical protein SCHPADRAFT_329817 [Schizopora paradoxa]
MPYLPTHDLYAEQLFPLDLGYALYEPDPGDSENEVRIGDIGYILNGGFERVASLFALGNGVNVVVEEKFRRIRAYGDIPGHVLSSKNIQSMGTHAGLAANANEHFNMSFGYTRKSTSGASLIKKISSDR